MTFLPLNVYVFLYLSELEYRATNCSLSLSLSLYSGSSKRLRYSYSPTWLFFRPRIYTHNTCSMYPYLVNVCANIYVHTLPFLFLWLYNTPSPVFSRLFLLHSIFFFKISFKIYSRSRPILQLAVKNSRYWHVCPPLMKHSTVFRFLCPTSVQPYFALFPLLLIFSIALSMPLQFPCLFLSSLSSSVSLFFTLLLANSLSHLPPCFFFRMRELSLYVMAYRFSACIWASLFLSVPFMFPWQSYIMLERQYLLQIMP